jgi:peptide deformylase
MALARVLLSVLAAALAACGPPASKPMSTSSPAATPATPAIVQTGAPVLRARAVEVAPERIQTAEIQGLIKTMIAAMRAAPGVGLAAPQIGVSLRVLVLEDTAERMAKLTADEVRERERVEVPVRVFINPVLRPVGEARRVFFEGCLSVDGYAALVERYTEVEVSGLDERGQPQTMLVRGWPARILQHEVDHLDGTLYVDRMVSRSFSTGEQVKERFAGKPIAEVLAMFGLAPPA